MVHRAACAPFAVVAAAVLAMAGCDKPRGADPGLGLRAERGETLAAAFASLPPGGPARVTPLFDNVEAWAARWRLVDEAKESVDVVTFILHDDLFGRSFLGLLARKAEQGVRVRLLVDSTGTMHAPEDRVAPEALAALDRRPNVDARAYNPIERAVPDVVRELSLLPAAAANHDKIIIVDGVKALIGGRNFADDYFADPADEPVVFRDKDVLFDSPAVAAKLRVAFEREYFDTSTVSIADDVGPVPVAAEADALAAARAMDAALRRAPLPPRALPPAARPSHEAPAPEARDVPERAALAVKAYPRMRGALQAEPPPAHEGEVRVLDSCSQAGCRRNDINEGLMRLVGAAQREIVIENPYLMLSDGGLEVLQDAARRGVRITLFTNSPVSSDNAITQAVFLEQWPKILAAVPTMRIFVAGDSHNIHGKLVTVDGVVTAIGSYNLDVLSAAMNSEVVGVVWSSSLAKAASASVLKRLQKGAPHVYEYRIRRDDDGAAVLDEHGAPIVEFGPEDHCDPDRWTQLALLRKAMKLREPMPDLSPLL